MNFPKTQLGKYFSNTLLLLPLLLIIGVAESAIAQANTSLTIRADVQEANARTGVITAKGNVKMDYPARQINATSSKAEYFSKERRIVLSGNVVVIQQGNRIKAETITYQIDQGTFQALPPSNRQVESVYIVPDEDVAANPTAATTPVQQIKPAFKSTVSPVIPAPEKKPEEKPEEPKTSPPPNISPTPNIKEN